MSEDRSDDATTVAPDRAPTDGDRPSFRVRAPTVDPRAAQRYERGKEIARGGLGRVTAALDRTLQREVAIKELHERTEQGMRRFVREGLTTARLQHPAIVPVLDAGTWEGGDPFLVMKLLAGKTLAEELAGRTTAEARVALLPNLLAIADALGYAHEQGVVHRDVKPSNIMIGTHGETVLLDWGIAHDGSATELESEGKGRGPEPVIVHGGGEPLTMMGTLAGTVRYMSPEQARGEPPVPGFDVYSLGLTIATVLGGSLHADGDSHEQVVARLRTARDLVARLPDDIPADLAAIVAKATAPVPERYPHAGLLADDLRKFIAGQLVSARRYTRRQLLARWIRRHRVLVGALAVVIAVAIVAARSVVVERNLAVAEREAAEERARDLVLLQARASLRSDPTATIAWLKQYPADAPHQDEVLALVDEAAGRGVARHVWRSASRTANLELGEDGRTLFSALRDGGLLRADLATGAVVRVGTADRPLRYLAAMGDAVYALDQEATLYRAAGTGPLERRQTIPFAAYPSGLWKVPATHQIKITFSDSEATFVDADSLAPPVPTKLPADLEATNYDDDENNANVWYVIMPDGKLYIRDGGAPARLLGSYAPNTWVRSSPTGSAYATVVPGPAGRGDRVTVWLGRGDGGDPVQVGAMRACEPGDDRDELAEVSDDANTALIRRCGTMVVFARGAEPREIDDAEHITTFDLSHDGRWLALGRSGGLELDDLTTGATRELAGGATVTLGDLRGAWAATAGGAQGTRVWHLDRDPDTIGIGALTAPTRLLVSARGELTILRHLQCVRWVNRGASFGIGADEARDVDEESLLWPADVSTDGGTCVFAGADGGIVVASAAAHRTLAAPAKKDLDGCALSIDTRRVSCATSEPAIVTFDVASGAVDQRAVTGKLRGLVRVRDRVIAVIDRPDGCALESLAGDAIARLPAGCLRAHATGPAGAESALVVERSNTVDVWTGDGDALAIPTEIARVEASGPRGLVAVPREQQVEIWDLATRARRDGPPPHVHAIERLAWSPGGLLASADDEIIQVWDPASGIVRVVYAPHTIAMVWKDDRLVTTDGKVATVRAIDVARGASVPEVRRRMDELTSAQIVDGLVVTP